eukprot:UN19936
MTDNMSAECGAGGVIKIWQPVNRNMHLFILNDCILKLCAQAGWLGHGR